MAWVKLHDGFTDHPKVVAAGWQAAWLYVCGLTYSARYLTDGRIPKAQVKRLADLPKPQQLADRLVEVGLWEDDGGPDYQVHGYTEWQTSAAQIEAERQAARDRRKGKRRPNVARTSPDAHANVGDQKVEGRSRSSSSSPSAEQAPLLNGAEEEEEPNAPQPTPEHLAELERRWQARNKPGLEPVTNPFAWRAKTLDDVMENHSPSPVAEPSRPYDRPACERGCVNGWLDDMTRCECVTRRTA